MAFYWLFTYWNLLSIELIMIRIFHFLASSWAELNNHLIKNRMSRVNPRESHQYTHIFAPSNEIKYAWFQRAFVRENDRKNQRTKYTIYDFVKKRYLINYENSSKMNGCGGLVFQFRCSNGIQRISLIFSLVNKRCGRMTMWFQLNRANLIFLMSIVDIDISFFIQ